MFTIEEIKYLNDAMYYSNRVQKEHYGRCAKRSSKDDKVAGFFEKIIEDLDKHYKSIYPKLKFLEKELLEAEEKKYER